MVEVAEEVGKEVSVREPVWEGLGEKERVGLGDAGLQVPVRLGVDEADRVTVEPERLAGDREGLRERERVTLRVAGV